MKVLVAQLCLTLCDPMDCGLPGTYVHGILQTRILQWVDIPFSRGSFLALQADSSPSELQESPSKSYPGTLSQTLVLLSMQLCVALLCILE